MGIPARCATAQAGGTGQLEPLAAPRGDDNTMADAELASGTGGDTVLT